jgi:hypothetical protein
MTIEQAAALRVILKLEFVGKTGELLKKSPDKNPTTVLSYVIRNAEIWSRLDSAIAYSMLEAYRKHEANLKLQDEIEVAIPHGMLDTIQGIIREGEYLETLVASKASQQAQLTMGSMVHIVIVERALEALKRILKVAEKPELVFFPMKAPEGKPC